MQAVKPEMHEKFAEDNNYSFYVSAKTGD